MKKNLLAFAFVLGLVALYSSNANAQGTLIHYWNFNNYALGAQYTVGGTIQGIAADFSIHDTSKAKILYAEVSGTSALYTTYIDSVQPKTSDYDRFQDCA